jgi:hypothetical protein
MLALSGCPSLPDLEWEGEHVRFYADNPEQVCGGTLESLDRRAGQLKARMGATHMIDYYWLPEGVEPTCPKVDGIVGCAHGHEVYSELVPDQHELVHTMSSMPPVLGEGLATHWGDPWPLYAMAPRERLYELLESTPDALSRMDEYARAAHFLAYLSETHGWESLVQLDAALHHRSKPKAIERAFLDVYGVSLDALLAAYEEYPDCYGNVDVSFACDGEPVPLAFGAVDFQREVDCSSQTAMGPYDGMVFVEELIEIAPSIGGSRIVQVTGDGADKGGFAIIRRCGPCSENGVFKLYGRYFLSEDELPAGRYVTQFYLPIESGPAWLGLYIGG